MERIVKILNHNIDIKSVISVSDATEIDVSKVQFEIRVVGLNEPILFVSTVNVDDFEITEESDELQNRKDRSELIRRQHEELKYMQKLVDDFVVAWKDYLLNTSIDDCA